VPAGLGLEVEEGSDRWTPPGCEREGGRGVRSRLGVGKG
jgi:hypothetical protein